MEIPSNTADKQRAVETPDNPQALQVVAGMSVTPATGGLPQHPWHQHHPLQDLQVLLPTLQDEVALRTPPWSNR
ncbi:UNVERIFIED_CONTAM: hypothetical protein Slati_0415200 [Sesamum latifolium]|uniref:Uncharacterized protein n=1 Tax=Sesamum latifolium TaxID=2727402 RepID=A0AAW2XW72_9LAMI